MRPPASAPPGYRTVKFNDDGGVIFKPENGQSQRDFGAFHQRFLANINDEVRARLATELGVAAEALMEIECGWTGSVWTFPERDAQGHVIGVLVRSERGRKRAMKQSKRGLIIPKSLPESALILIVEGPSDVAACLTMGLAAVGRPSNSGGGPLLGQHLRGRDVLVVGENDRKEDGLHPGRNGAISIARQLANEWNVPVRFAMPPDEVKDVRAWLNGHDGDPGEAGRALVEQLETNAEIIEPQPEPVTFRIDRVANRVKANVTAFQGESAVAVDTFNPNSEAARQRFAQTVAERCGADPQGLADDLLRAAIAPPPAPSKSGGSPEDLLAQYDEDVLERLERSDRTAVRDAEAMLDHPGLVNLVLDDIAFCGVVGEQESALATYIIGVSRLLSRPVAGIVQGSTSSGKSYVIERVANLFPPEAVLMATDMTPNALYYLEEGRLIHRLVVAGERSRRQDDDRAEATRALREMIASGKLRKAVPIRVGSRMETVVIEQDGPIAFIESTTLSQIFDEDANRALLLATDESPEQTRRVMAATAQRAMMSAPDIGPVVARHHALQRLLKRCHVVIPFADRLAIATPYDRPEARRAISHTLNLIAAVALLHQRQRSRRMLVHGEEIEADIEDYVIAMRLLDGPLGRALGGGLPEAVARFGRRLRDRYGDDTFTTSQAVKDDPTIKSRGRASEYLRALDDAGAATVVEPARGNKPAVWRMLSDIPEGGALWLPAPECLVQDHTSHAVTVSPEVEKVSCP